MVCAKVRLFLLETDEVIKLMDPKLNVVFVNNVYYIKLKSDLHICYDLDFCI